MSRDVFRKILGGPHQSEDTQSVCLREIFEP